MRGLANKPRIFPGRHTFTLANENMRAQYIEDFLEIPSAWSFRKDARRLSFPCERLGIRAPQGKLPLHYLPCIPGKICVLLAGPHDTLDLFVSWPEIPGIGAVPLLA